MADNIRPGATVRVKNEFHVEQVRDDGLVRIRLGGAAQWLMADQLELVSTPLPEEPPDGAWLYIPKKSPSQAEEYINRDDFSAGSYGLDDESRWWRAGDYESGPIPWVAVCETWDLTDAVRMYKADDPDVIVLPAAAKEDRVVSVHRWRDRVGVGELSVQWLTPNQARRLARDLCAVADHIDADGAEQ